jgi:hypothetical protein
VAPGPSEDGSPAQRYDTALALISRRPTFTAHDVPRQRFPPTDVLSQDSMCG